MLEIASRDFLRRSRPAKPIARVNVSYNQSPYGHLTPPDSAIWREAAEMLVKFHTRSRVSPAVEQADSSGKYKHFQYLGAQWAVCAHTLQFWSTHQYYRTVKYQLHRTTSDEPRWTFCFSDLKSWDNRIPNETWDRCGHLTGCSVTKYKKLIIFILSGAMELILHSSIVLMSASKL